MFIRVVKVYKSIAKPFIKNIKGSSFVKVFIENLKFLAAC